MKKVKYTHRIKEGAYKTMTNTLIYSEQALAIKDGEICRIIELVPLSNNYLRKRQDTLENPVLYQIELFTNIEHHALIYPELLIELTQDEWVFEI